ncbi:UNVERIFIED_CONTAM: hypothetical protein FKN15_073256 [Acipenser sinensis]
MPTSKGVSKPPIGETLRCYNVLPPISGPSGRAELEKLTASDRPERSKLLKQRKSLQQRCLLNQIVYAMLAFNFIFTAALNCVLLKPGAQVMSVDITAPPPEEVGLNFSTPWHDSFKKNRKEIGVNLHILHPAMRTMLDMGYATFSDLLLIDLSDIHSKLFWSEASMSMSSCLHPAVLPKLSGFRRRSPVRSSKDLQLTAVIMVIFCLLHQKVQTVQSWLTEGTSVYVDAKIADHIMQKAQGALKSAVEINLEAPREHFTNYVERYDWLVNGTAESRVQNYIEQEHTFDEYTEFVEEFRLLSRQIMSLPSIAHYDMVHLDCEDLKQGLAKKAKSFTNILLETLVKQHREHNEQICKDFEIIKEKALKIPETTEEMMEILAYVEQTKTKGIQELNTRIAVIEHYKRKGESELLGKREKVMLELEKLTRRMKEFAECSELDMMQQYVNDVRTVQIRLQEAEESISFINKEETLYKWDQTFYPEVESLKVSIEPYQKLFALVLKWQRTEKR